MTTRPFFLSYEAISGMSNILGHSENSLRSSPNGTRAPMGLRPTSPPMKDDGFYLTEAGHWYRLDW